MASAAFRDPVDRLFAPLIGLFGGGGVLASVESLIVPRLQLELRLGYAHALAVQLVYFAGYLCFALPAAWVTVRLGALRALAAALATMAFGCALLAVAQTRLSFPAMLASLLLLSSGVTVVQIACNGLVAGAGTRAAGRFTLLQGCNSAGTVLGPLMAAWFLLGGERTAGAVPFVLLALLFAALALPFAHVGRAADPAAPARRPALLGHLVRLAADPVVARGLLAIFAYVGAEVTIGSLAVAYLLLPGGADVGAVAAARLVSLYWGGAMVGRFAGVALLRRRSPATLLAGAAMGGVALTALAAALPGRTGAAALLAVGLCNSIVFPLVYSLAMPPDPRDTAPAATLLCMAVVGGAAIPVLTGLVADHASLRAALVLPALCYLPVFAFARHVAHRPGASA